MDIAHRLLENHREIIVLLQEQKRLLELSLPKAEPELFFDDSLRRIYWNGGSIKLGKKSYLFVKTIWQGKHHQAEFSELEENVWERHVESEMFIARRTVSALVLHIQKNLTEANFPYKIECVKNCSNRALEGFRLILSAGQKKTFPSE